MGAIGRNRFVGADRRTILRLIDRSMQIVKPKPVHHVALLPPARDNEGRIMFVAGATKAFYYSNGTSWAAL